MHPCRVEVTRGAGAATGAAAFASIALAAAAPWVVVVVVVVVVVEFIEHRRRDTWSVPRAAGAGGQRFK